MGTELRGEYTMQNKAVVVFGHMELAFSFFLR